MCMAYMRGIEFHLFTGNVNSPVDKLRTGCVSACTTTPCCRLITESPQCLAANGKPGSRPRSQALYLHLEAQVDIARRLTATHTPIFLRGLAQKNDHVVSGNTETLEPAYDFRV